jgi:hypothetical protein
MTVEEVASLRIERCPELRAGRSRKQGDGVGARREIRDRDVLRLGSLCDRGVVHGRDALVRLKLQQRRLDDGVLVATGGQDLECASSSVVEGVTGFEHTFDGT